MSSDKNKGIILTIYDALINGNKEALVNSFSSNAVVFWGPYKFEGIREIVQWGEEFHLMFKDSICGETKINNQNEELIHTFRLQTPFPDGRIGNLLCKGTYRFREGQVEYFKVVITRGYISVTSEIAKKL